MSGQPQERLTALERLRNVPLHVVLVEPEIPPNTGNVARLCAATGCALHLVEPLGFRIDDRELKRAGLDYWQSVELVLHPSLETFLATTQAMRRWYLSTRAQVRYDQATFARGDMLVFGKETAGLPQTLLSQYPERCLRIPLRAGSVRSLNLATAAGIVTYAALAQCDFPQMA